MKVSLPGKPDHQERKQSRNLRLQKIHLMKDFDFYLCPYERPRLNFKIFIMLNENRIGRKI
jgi:hypothetical protein